LIDQVLLIVVSILISSFVTHLVTNYANGKKHDSVMAKLDGLSTSITELALSLKEYVRQEVHKDDISEIYDRIRDVEKADCECRRCINFKRGG